MEIQNLHPPRFRPLPLGAILASGWLRNQLTNQAEGLTGHLDEFWPDVRDSRWFGGQAEGWERAPYWLDGLLPLAYGLGDSGLMEKAGSRIGYILDHQAEDGWLGPREATTTNAERTDRYDPWAQFLMLKVLAQYGDVAGERRLRVEQAIGRGFRKIEALIDTAPLFNWSQFRWFEALIPLFWLHERAPRRGLLDLAVKLRAQGFDWLTWGELWPAPEPTPHGQWNFMTHVVNNAMALKAGALGWRLTGAARDRQGPATLLGRLDRDHGQVHGLFSGDECLAGTSPDQGVELCAVVESMFSFEVALAILGEAWIGDRLERVAFNALPAAISPDAWSHQYVQQANQIECSIREDWPWTTNETDANIFGLEPNFGCCTANLHQGWPKFTSHLWMRVEGGGLAAVAWAPCRVACRVGEARVSVDVRTDYPFGERIEIELGVDRPIRMPLWLRIPGWAEGATLSLEGEDPVRPRSGSFHVMEREWRDVTSITLVLPMTTRLEPRPSGGVGVLRGPLVYALPLEEQWQRIHEDMPGRELPHGDWEIRTHSAWNYALTEGAVVGAVCAGSDAGVRPFSPEGAPVRLRLHARRHPGWQAQGACTGLPPGAAPSKGPPETIELIPYGCTNLRVGEFARGGEE